ncbi:1,4-alpha-glucan-branching enzyme [Trema orientale]|uniref:1,4-alpha-glucan-branching enzyme n=1 Tax=Trema orientale TaxID=63057 RepID=A0A2P5ES45_TREOI|nr:1,4-alpha-glucan-branching enzyme [Trema orientale]
MAVRMGVCILITIMALPFRFKLSNPQEVKGKPEFAFSWLNDKDTYKAGDIATIKIKVLNNFDKLDKNAFKPTLSVSGKTGNSSYVSGVLTDLEGNPDDWNVFFTTITAGLFNVMINEDRYQVFDSSLHFQVEPGRIYPSICFASWMGYVNEFEAGARARVLILPKDAFGNNVTSTGEDPSSHNLTLSALYGNGSVADSPNVTRIGWNGSGYISIEFIVVKAGDFLLLVRSGNQALSGTPLPFKVNPGPLEVSNCVTKWNYEPNAWQLFSKMELFIHQQDQYGNLVPGLYEFDAEVVEKETNLSIPVPDLYFEEVEPGIQLFSFSNLEPGNFLLKISDIKHNKSISNMPYAYTVFVGYCNGSNCVVNGTGLNNSVAGEVAELSIYLRDSFLYPSPVEVERPQVQITREIDSYNVLPVIAPMQIINDSELARGLRYGSNQAEVAPSPSVNLSDPSVGNLSVLATSFNVTYTPDKSGIYSIRVFCGNIMLNGGHSFIKEVRAGEVNISLSGVVKFAPKVPKLIKNEVVVQLMDSFHNPVMSQQSRLKLEVASSMKNTSGFSSSMFLDNNDGSYTGHYTAKDTGTYQICASFDGKRFSPCPFEVNVYSSEYFPRAFDDAISVWEDESTAFDALANDFFAGDNATILEFSEPSHGSLLQYGRLLRYTPQKDYYGNDSFMYTISDINGNLATASVNISVLTIPPQFVSFPSQLQATEDELSPKFGGFSGFEIRYSDMRENISVNLSAQSGTISLSPMPIQFWPIKNRLSVYKGDGEAKCLVLEGTVEVVNYALKSIQYFGNENFFGSDTVRISTRNTNGVNNMDVPVFLDPINDPPFINIPEFIILKSNEEESLIYDSERDKFKFLIGDPDLQGFSGDDSFFMVIFSVEVDSGFLVTSLPAELINTTELRTMNSYRWQPLQTYVTISKHFTVKANGIRFKGTINDCNSVMKQLFYNGGYHGTILTVTVNDMGNYGCYPDCSENVSVPLYAEANVNLIRRRPMSSFVSHALGSAIVIESIVVLTLGVVLLSFTCKCAIVLVNERRNNAMLSTKIPEAASLKGTAMAASENPVKVGTKIVAVGRNYAAHAKELGNAVPKEPMLFLKPTSSYLEAGGTIEIPQPLEWLDHDVELAVVIGKRARDVPEDSAMDYVAGYALALDMTARQIQAPAKSAGLPWDIAKGQDTFTPISSFLPKASVADPENLELWLKVDGEVKQQGSTKDMIFKIPFLISHISSFMTLFEGDVILTGTPEGVGPVKAGQKITAGITNLLDVNFNVEKRKRQ